MKAKKNWPLEASFLVDWLEKNNLIEEVEEIEGIRIKDANDDDGIGSLFDFGETKKPGFWISKSVDYCSRYYSANLTGDYKKFYKLRNKE